MSYSIIFQQSIKFLNNFMQVEMVPDIFAVQALGILTID